MPRAISSGLVRTDIVAYLLDGELVLYDERQAKLFALNPTASFIWSSFASGLGVDTVALELSQSTGVSLERASADIESILATWTGANLLAAALPPARDAGPPRDVTRVAHRRPNARGAGYARSVRLMDRGLRIVADSDLAPAMEMVFGQAFVADNETPVDWPTLSAYHDRGRWVLSLDHEPLAACTERTEIVPMIYGNAARLIYEAADCFAAVHAAAVAKNGCCALLPAISTSGKSTLTAALIASGYEYCTDDLAILTSAPTHLRPVPMKIGLKSGSWDLLAKFWPQLASLESHRRADGQWIKYLDPRACGRAPRTPDESLVVSVVVFPRFVRGSVAELRPLSRAQALTRMAEAGYDLSGKVDRAAVESLVQWFTTLACYELQFDSLDEAVAVFANVWR